MAETVSVASVVLQGLKCCMQLQGWARKKHYFTALNVLEIRFKANIGIF